MQGTVFTLARLKIVPIIKNLYNIQCQCVNEWSSLVRIKLQYPFPDNYQPSRQHIDPHFFPLAFESAAVFFIIDESSVSMEGFPRLSP